MPEEGTQNNVTNQPETKSSINWKKRLHAVWLSDVVCGWLFVMLGTILTICGSPLLSSHQQPFWTAWSLITMGVYCFAGGAYFWLVNHRKKQSINKMPLYVPWAVCMCIMGIGTVTFLIAVSQEMAGPPAPRAWLPPEMSSDCKTAYVLFLDGEFKIDLDDVKKHNNEFVVMNGIAPFKVRIKDHRLYVDVENALEAQFINPEWPVKWADPTTNENSRAFSDVAYLDQKLKPGQDRNYSKTAFEVVGPDPEYIPLFQCIYERPNAVRINGVFQAVKEGFTDEWGLYAFGRKDMQPFLFQNSQDMANNMRFLATNRLFKYPSYKHLGEFADATDRIIPQLTIPELHPLDDTALLNVIAFSDSKGSLVYTIQNIGGISATNFQGEWYVVDSNRADVTGWTNLWRNEIIPRENWKTFTMSPRTNGERLYQGLISGELSCLANFRYKDVLQHDYWMTIHVTYTNNQFQNHPVAKGGYFDEVTDEHISKMKIQQSHGITN
jgi:hypothetical protein